MKKRLLAALMALAVGAMPALGLAEGTVAGDFEAPAPLNPLERYEEPVEEDGSDQLLFMTLDALNDEAADIEAHGALYITEHPVQNEVSGMVTSVEISIQDCPYGRVLCSVMRLPGVNSTSYAIGKTVFYYADGSVTPKEIYAQEQYEFYCNSYHFPYGKLESVKGVRQDANGYLYFLIKNNEDRDFEFETDENMRILQLRIYERNGDGDMALASYIDYSVGPAWEIPQPVLDAMKEASEN